LSGLRTGPAARQQCEQHDRRAGVAARRSLAVTTVDTGSAGRGRSLTGWDRSRLDHLDGARNWTGRGSSPATWPSLPPGPPDRTLEPRSTDTDLCPGRAVLILSVLLASSILGASWEALTD